MLLISQEHVIKLISLEKFHTSNKTKREISLTFNTNINWNKHTINKTILQKIDKFNVQIIIKQQKQNNTSI